MILRKIKIFIWRLSQHNSLKWVMVLYCQIEALFEKMRGKHIVHVLHIGKTGGTALQEALKDNLRTSKYKIKLHGHNFKLKNVPKGASVVFFVRNPMDRFISAFYSRKREGRPRFDNPWRRSEKRAFSMFNTPDELAVALSSGDSNLKKEAIKAMKGGDRPSWGFLLEMVF